MESNSLRIIVLICAFLGTLSCNFERGMHIGEKISCDAETLNEDGSFFVSTEGKYFFENVKARTDEESFSGTYSIKLSKTNPYGFAINITNTAPDNYYKISVWKKGNTENGILVASSLDSKKLYQPEWKVGIKEKNGWEQVTLDLNIPPNYTEDIVKVYVWNNGNEDIYFDDIKIERKIAKVFPEYHTNVLRIFIDSSDIIKLKVKRREAFNNGILESSDYDWVDAIVFQGDEMLESKTRLKGDWLDHLYGDKWSFRIGLKKDYFWNGMNTFSIHTPTSRNFVYEWFLHKIFAQEDVLTTRYGFVPVELNGKSLGIYAYEEHFEKQLVENKKRREGPILKLSEELFWIVQKLFIANSNYKNLPYYDASEIVAFKQNRTIADTVLNKQFLIAQDLVNQFKFGKRPVSELFNVDLLARYLALINITKAYHGIAWHNLRFYFNPVLCNLELVAFDCFYDENVQNSGYPPILGSRYLGEPNQDIKNEELLYYYLFSDSILVNKYIFYLEKYSEEEFIETLLNGFDEEINYYTDLIKREFDFYNFDRQYFLSGAASVKSALPAYKERIKQDVFYSGSQNERIIKYDSTYNMEFIPAMVKAFRIGNSANLLSVRVENYYAGEISIIGSGANNNKIDNHFMQPVDLESYNIKNNSSTEFLTDTLSQYIFFKAKKYNQAFYLAISNWPSPGSSNPRQEIFGDVDFDQFPFLRVDGNNLTFMEGIYSVSYNVIIPAGYNVTFQPGLHLDFINGSGFISLSAINMEGVKNNEILITSSDNTAMGFSVLGASDESIINYTVFDGFNTLDYKGWVLTGAVNFYESDVNIKNTKFINNYCEDALNIIRSDFLIDKCLFSNIYSDAFDSDFCEGKLSNTEFNIIGNDAVDFSTSVISINDCVINKAGDKGISGGEASTLEVLNTRISGANIGIASKDLSVVRITNTQIADCVYGFVVFRKKPEFGSSKVIAMDVECKNVQTMFFIEKGSSVNFNGEMIFGNELNVADVFYTDSN